jgi:BTB/POZ domain
MATISIDYDSKGDVELILEKKDNTPLNQAAQQVSQSSEEEELVRYNVGPLGIKVKEFRLRVSSFKLISSSRYFQKMLEGSRFREGKELNEHGFIEIELLDPEDEPTAMMIILGILYGTDVQVPVKLDLPTLDKVAILVDKYQWHALVTPHAISWLDNLLDSRGYPDTIDETLLMWLFIASLFGMKDQFKTLSKVAQQDACSSIDLTDEGIRLSTRVLSK